MHHELHQDDTLVQVDTNIHTDAVMENKCSKILLVDTVCRHGP